MKHAFASLAIMAIVTAGHLATVHHLETPSADKYSGETQGVPSTIGGFRQQGEDVPVEPHVKAILQTENILMRRYASPQGEAVDVSIVTAGGTRKSLHFPEVCLTGGGWEIREQYTAPVGFLFSAKRLVLIKGTQSEAVIYWFRVGNYSTGSFFENSLYWAFNRLRFHDTTTKMMRVSTMVANGDCESAFSILERFAEDINGEMDRQARMVGRRS
jgi:EpsI family protein